jgi:outer membrane translocation and assembly module TamA
VSFLGLPTEIPEATARALVVLPDGGPFDYEPYDDAKDTLLHLLQDRGYAHARIVGSVAADRVHAQATLDYVIESGPRCVFGDIGIQGIPEGALARAVSARVSFHTGTTYSISAIEKTTRLLYGVGRFSTVQVKPDLTDDTATVVNVKILLSEANRHELRVGFGVGLDPLDYSLRARAVYSQAGVFDPLTTLSAEFRPALTLLRDTSGDSEEITPVVRLIGRLTRSDIGLPNVKGEVEGGLDFATIEAYTQTGFRARLGLSSPLGWDKLVARVGWTFGVFTFSNISPAIDVDTSHRLGLDTTERLGAYTEAISLDLRDRPIEPRRGAFAAIQLTEGTAAAGGADSYLELAPELRTYLPLGPLVLAARVHLATISGTVPVTERLYGGGASSNRGFSERRLSPIARTLQPDHTTAEVVIGGTALVETGAELRLPVYSIIGVVAFLDGGDVTDTPSQLNVGDLHWAAGGGLRFFTPIGPVRFDIGYRLNRFGVTEPEPNDRYHFFIGVGEAY